jgi:hypothetical protein
MVERLDKSFELEVRLSEQRLTLEADRESLLNEMKGTVKTTIEANVTPCTDQLEWLRRSYEHLQEAVRRQLEKEEKE